MQLVMYRAFRNMVYHPFRKFLNIAFVAITSFSFTSAHANDAVILLNQMNEALRTLEYQGKLVYLKGGEFYNLAIRHTLEDGVAKEVITSLDDNGDEYIRESNAFSLSGLPKITPKMQEIYSFDLGGMSKVAGRPCRIVLARPKDRKRYLQKYCIDLDRSVLLKYSLINQHHEPVERFMFTDFDVISTKHIVETPVDAESNVVISDSMGISGAGGSADQSVQPKTAQMQKMTNSLISSESTSILDESEDNDITKLSANDSANGNETSVVSSPDSSSPDNYSEWFFDTLPTGFNIVSADKVRNPEGEDEQIIISDGLSSVSVFISSDNTETKQYQPIQSGALNILSKVYQGHAITLVGEVPESTLHDIFKRIKKATIDK